MDLQGIRAGLSVPETAGADADVQRVGGRGGGEDGAWGWSGAVGRGGLFEDLVLRYIGI